MFPFNIHAGLTLAVCLVGSWAESRTGESFQISRNGGPTNKANILALDWCGRVSTGSSRWTFRASSFFNLDKVSTASDSVTAFRRRLDPGVLIVLPWDNDVSPEKTDKARAFPNEIVEITARGQDGQASSYSNYGTDAAGGSNGDRVIEDSGSPHRLSRETNGLRISTLKPRMGLVPTARGC
ncbi:hypothetical protein FA15DRAFT_700526 [Coprinopsis marcescibilis]|uniref:Uncharacterized protein n=1 Tax=Coprinopsis marcescibilis TaxID=230819 RepID=A0A5C3L8Z3_COPMA|nr:hypothetical protein FA15DRAFT_700526 [Coprinopsis marcescibilis]